MLVNGSRSIIGLFNAWFTHTTQRQAQASHEDMTVNEPNESQIIAPACVARTFTCVVGAIGYYSFFFHGRLHLLIKCSLSISCRFLFQCDWLINLQSVSCYPVTLTSPNDSCKKNFLSNQTRSFKFTANQDSLVYT